MKDRIKYYFVADIHFGHNRIMHFKPDRAKIMGINVDDPMAIKQHDEWIINKWNSTITKKDYVYILGDFSFHGVDETKKILERLNGHKILVYGNHDKASRKLLNYFETAADIKDIVFREKNDSLDFINQSFRLILCHYPLISWNHRMRGVCHIHGHVHGNLDEINLRSGELRVDVGFDGSLCNYGFIEVEELYKYFMKITKGVNFREYIENKALKENIRY